MINAILWVLRTGAPWRDLSGHYPPWKSVYTRFSRWSAQGIWQQVLAELTKEADTEGYLIDGTSGGSFESPSWPLQPFGHSKTVMRFKLKQITRPGAQWAPPSVHRVPQITARPRGWADPTRARANPGHPKPWLL
jgi:transposase